MKLFAHPDKDSTKKIFLAAAYSGLDIDLPKGGGADDGRITVLETDQGCIFTTGAIVRYISRMRRDLGLYGHTLLESGSVDSWYEFCTHELEVPLGAWCMQDAVPANVVEKATSDVRKALTVINNHLLHYTYMAGDQITLADISVCCVIHTGMKKVLSSAFMSEFGNLKRWFNLCMAQAEFQKILGKVETCSDAAKPAAKKQEAAAKKEPAPKKEAAAKKEPAPKKEAAGKKEPAPKKDAAPKKDSGKKDAAPKKDEKPADPVVDRKALMKKAVKEGGKRGVEIEGAADMGGLQFFCTAVETPEGDMELLEACIQAMNAKSDPTEEERKGGSGHIGKMIFSAGVEQLAVAAYVPEDKLGELKTEEWLKAVLDTFGGKVSSTSPTCCMGAVKADGDKGIFPLKIREPMILEANNFLRKKGLFPEDNSDDDEMVFGDDDFPS